MITILLPLTDALHKLVIGLLEYCTTALSRAGTGSFGLYAKLNDTNIVI